MAGNAPHRPGGSRQCPASDRLPLPRIPDLAIYLGMGWLILIALRPLLHALPWQGVAWIGAGGFFYTGGIVFFALDKRFARAHGIWHLCVLAGGISHYLAVLHVA